MSSYFTTFTRSDVTSFTKTTFAYPVAALREIVNNKPILKRKLKRLQLHPINFLNKH